jgi:hypothetical protein
MKTAQGSISVDVSKFVGPLEVAKGKLEAFSSSLGAVGNIAKMSWKAFDAIAGVSEKISTIKKGAKDLESIFTALPTIIGRVSGAFENLKVFISQVGGIISKMPTWLKAVGAAGIIAGAGVYATYKSLSLIASIGKGVIGTIGSITSKLVSAGKGGLSAVGGALTTTFSALGSVAKGVAIGIGSVGAAIGITDQFFKIGIKSAIELGDEYNTLSKRTGASVGFLYDLGKILQNNGSSANAGATAIAHMQRALTGVNELGQPTADIFKRLKLDMDDLQKIDPSKSLVKTLQAILKLGTAAEQTRAVTEVFGKAGIALLAVAKDEGFAKLANGISSTGQTLEKNAENFSRISALLRDSGSSFRGFFIEMAGAVAPEILKLFGMFQGGDALAGFGKKLGTQIKYGVDVLLGAFQSGMIFEMLKSSFETSGVVLKDLLERTFTYGSNLIGKLMESNVSTALFTAIKGAGMALLGAFSVVAGGLVKLFATPLAFFSAGLQTAFEKSMQFFAEKFPKIAGLMGIGGFKAGSFKENMAERKDAIMGFANETISGGFENITSGMKDAVDGAVDSFSLLKKTLTEFPPQSEEAKNAIADLRGKLDALAVVGKPAEKAITDVTGGAELGAKSRNLKNAMKDVAVSSLQRIGGGGAAFGSSDPLLKASQDQLSEQKQQTAILKQLVKNPSGYILSVSQNGQEAVFGGR